MVFTLKGLRKLKYIFNAPSFAMENKAGITLSLINFGRKNCTLDTGHQPLSSGVSRGMKSNGSAIVNPTSSTCSTHTSLNL